MKKGTSGWEKLKNALARFLAASLAAAMVCAASVPACADDWEGWDDEAIEEAWLTYSITEWNEVGDFYYDADGSIARSTVPDSFRTLTAGTVYSSNSADFTIYRYEDLCDAVVSDYKSGSYGSQYSELLLSIIYVLYTNRTADCRQDPTGYYPFLTNTEPAEAYTSEATDPETGEVVSSVYVDTDNVYAHATKIFSRLLSCMDQYEKSYGNSVSIYSNDEALGAVIQGVIYGTSYVKANSAYSEGNAASFSDSTSTFIADKARGWNDFATEVQSYYQALTCTGHYVIG